MREVCIMRHRSAILINEMCNGPATMLVGGRLVIARPSSHDTRRMREPVRERTMTAA